jgi:hypothetical protein
MDVMQTVGRPQAAASIFVAYTDTAGTTAVVPTGTRVVRLLSTTDCFVEITRAGTAAVANTGMYLPALTPEYVQAGDGFKVSAIRVAADGTIYVTPF